MPKDDFNIPIVLIAFRRPETTKKVLTAIAQVRPTSLWVITDGAREDHPTEAILVKETRLIIDQIEWDCEVRKNYANTNMGLRHRVVSGLNWVFKHVEHAIILEDDCVPDPSFFYYCAELLERYSHDNRIMAISGDNFQRGHQRTPYSYYFSRYPHCWGWATWQRAWQHYDDDISFWPEISNQGWLTDILGPDRRAIQYWQRIFQNVYEDNINSWAYRWTLSCWANSGLTILPNTNLVSNIGFEDGATHTVSYKKVQPSQTQPIIFPLRHPPFIIRDQAADDFTQKTHYGSGVVKSLKRMIIQVLKKLGLLRLLSNFKR